MMVRKLGLADATLRPSRLRGGRVNVPLRAVAWVVVGPLRREGHVLAPHIQDLLDVFGNGAELRGDVRLGVKEAAIRKAYGRLGRKFGIVGPRQAGARAGPGRLASGRGEVLLTDPRGYLSALVLV